jgi:tRNA G10  N-methylase Trm11
VRLAPGVGGFNPMIRSARANNNFSNSSTIWDIELDYFGENNYASFFTSNSNIHSYPAKALPDMVQSLLEKIVSEYDNITTVLDPFVGSGTIALESKIMGLHFYGSDLNPLAVLLARTKSLKINNTSYIERQLDFFINCLDVDINKRPIELVFFENIDYWFKKENINELSYIKQSIASFLKRKSTYKEVYALILLTAFSSTIREVSLTRNGEFKLYRMSPKDIEKFQIDAIKVFKKKVSNLLDLLEQANNIYLEETNTEIRLANAKNLDYLENSKVQLVLTSPPYGDSSSTVAYGQFSRLSLQWMDDMLAKYLSISVNNANCDEELLGGKRSITDITDIHIIERSKTLQRLVEKMEIVVLNQVKESLVLREKVDELLTLINNRLISQVNKVTTEGLLVLIKERVRLEILRMFKYSKNSFTDKQIKKIAQKEADQFCRDLLSSRKTKVYRRLMQLKDKIPYIRETVNRKIEYQPKRKNEIMHFFRDLYEVVEETDRVLEKGGIQAWIVGHRTVLGKLTVNMERILNDWFEELNYRKITTLERKYSFKRMPHHIKSTITRNEKIKTMMQEHILVVQKE